MIRLFFPAALLCFVVISCCTRSFAAEGNSLNYLLLVQKKIPLFVSKENPNVAEIHFMVSHDEQCPELESVKLLFNPGGNYEAIEKIALYHRPGEENREILFGETDNVTEHAVINGYQKFSPGCHSLSFGFKLKNEALLHRSLQIQQVELVLASGEKYVAKPEKPYVYRPATVVRAAGQDGCHTYRIPGLITTKSGTLIAVYDNRYNNSKDLQEDIDVGMSRSTDGGQTWEPMKVIMDMGEWGGHSERLNGIGDPSVLYDPFTHTIWVAGLWMSGGTPDDMLWWSSKPGLSPVETGQFMLTKSTDDGLTWSQPVNITRQIKHPEWQLLLQGPGRGITLNDGTLVFPAQFKADIGSKAIDGGQYTSHSTIVYSTDSGQTWQIGTGAKPNTTEAQVVQLPDGSLMLNMRDDRNRQVKDQTNGRAVAVTADMGKTWSVHPSSNGALPEPNCMASLISADVKINGKTHRILFFSNPNNRKTRTNMTLKASLDNGNSWPREYQAELNELQGFGYSCLTMVDDNTVGILYEGSKSLYFQKIPVNEIIKEMAGKHLH